MKNTTKQLSLFVSIFLIAFCFPFFALHSQTQRPDPVYGFYKGGFYFITVGGETAYKGGSLLK